jgi:lysophospholipase L1-like esterase
VYPFQYEIGLVADSIYIIGGCYGTTYAAANYFLDYLRSVKIENNGVIKLPTDLKLSGTHDLEVIGCIGDSITQGYEKETPKYVSTWDAYNYFSYPAYLQRMYWKTAYVYNFGKASTTMRSDSDGTHSYQKCYRWKNCVKNLANILDYVIIQLGTNDSKLFPDTPWTDEDNQQFIDDFFVLISTLSQENSNIKFLMSNCPYNFSSSLHAADFIRELQSECYQQAVNEGYNIKFLDMKSLSNQRITVENYQSDKLHPNYIGYAIMGQIMSEALNRYWNLGN